MTDLMGDLPLSLDLLLRRAVRHFPGKEVRSASPAGTSTTTYDQVAHRAALVSGALDALGVPVGSRVASLCWSTIEHLDLYFGVPCAGRVLHTLNPRFRPEQIAEVIAEAGDHLIFVHASLVPVVAAVAPLAPSLQVVVVVDDGTGSDHALPAGLEVHRYDELMGSATPGPLAVADERQAAVLCHTGGTTGLPKGVLYSHRSLVLHAMAVTAAGAIGICERDTVMPVVPLFHANAVGFPHAAVGCGATLVLPGPDLSGPALADLLEAEAVSVTNGVPTIWASVLPHVTGRSLPHLRLIISGASAVPPSLSAAFESAIGVPLTQIWGMTETSPLGTIAVLPADLVEAEPGEQEAYRSTVGPPVLGVEARVVDRDGSEVPPDAATSGELQVRGPWVATGYFGGRAQDSFTADGWLKTGDVATVDGRRSIRIVDRIKDVIKSGGEWISSIELELHLMAHPAVAEAAVVAVADDRWGERPVAYVVAVDPHDPPSPRALADHLAGKVPSWWVPDRFDLIDEIPKTSVGKFSKATLRDRAR